MKRWNVAAIAVCLMFAGLPSWSEETGGKPKMQIVEPSYNAGDLYKSKTKIEHNFVIKNIGKADLQILNAKPGCGCTVTQFDKVIAAGAEGKVQASVDISHFKGPIEKGIDLETNDPDQARARLTVRANIKTIVDVKPTDQVRFSVNKGEGKKEEFVLIPTYEKPLQIKNVTVDSDHFTVELIQPDAGSQKPEYKLNVAVKETAPIGTQTGSVQLALEGGPVPMMEIPVTAIVRGPISTNPSLVSLQIKRFPEEVTNANPINMRLQPDVSAPVVTKLSPGQHLRVIAQRENWYQVIAELAGPTPPTPSEKVSARPAAGARIGWVTSKLVKVTKQPLSATNQTVSILKSTGNFKILEYKSTSPEIKLELDPAPEESQKFTLKVSLANPDQIKQTMRPAAILIKTNDIDQPEIKIPVHVIVS